VVKGKLPLGTGVLSSQNDESKSTREKLGGESGEGKTYRSGN
jgi:hypothetical protein